MRPSAPPLPGVLAPLLLLLLGPLLPAAAGAAAAAAAAAAGADLTFVVPASAQLPNPGASLPASTHATLTALGARGHAAPLTVGGAFVFGNVTAGSYLAEVHCATHAFAPLRVDLTPRADGEAAGPGRGAMLAQVWETYRGNDWDNRGEVAGARELAGGGGTAYEVRLLGPKNYFVERSQFSVFAILKNPMILLGLVSMVLFFGMPKLMDNMDPEMRAEFEERQKSNPMNALMGGGGGQAQNPMGNFDMASFLAGAGKDKSGADAAGGQGGGKKDKKR